MPNTDRRKRNNAPTLENLPFGQAGSPRIPGSSAPDSDERLRKIVHDLRSPLGAMKIWVHLLRTGNLSPEEEARALEVLQTSTTTLESLISEVLGDKKPYPTDI